jgi:hypothetical protein
MTMSIEVLSPGPRPGIRGIASVPAGVVTIRQYNRALGRTIPETTMKKSLLLVALASLIAAPAFARYTVILKDGTRYLAKAKWTVVNGKAIVKLENGQTVQLDPALIDAAKSEQATKSGYDGTVLDLDPNMPQTQTASDQPSLGDTIRLRPRPNNQPAAPKPATPAPVASNVMPQRVIDTFERAYDELRIFERKIEPTGPNALRATLTVDTEERVFQVISATSFLIVKNAGSAARSSKPSSCS